MLVRASLSALKNGRWYEYVVRFVLGGAATVFTGLIGSRFGPSLGGLFLAMPAIFCASATLIEAHQRRRKRAAGLAGSRRGGEAAALDASGAVFGSLGLLVFAAVFSFFAATHVVLAFLAACLAFAGISVGTWWLHRHWRLESR